MKLTFAMETERVEPIAVTFRGMCTLLLEADGGNAPRRARVVLPRNDLPRVAFGNPRYTIPPYESYVAIPLSAEPSREADLKCKMPLRHGGTYEPGSAIKLMEQEHSSLRGNFEALTRAERRRRIFEEPDKVPYAVYFLNKQEVIIEGLSASTDVLVCDATPVPPNAKPGHFETSVRWLPHLDVDDEPSVQGTIDLRVTGRPPATVTAFVDMNRGTLRPRGLYKSHQFRFLHSDSKFLRPIASEMVVHSDTKETGTVVLRPLGRGEDVTIRFKAAGQPQIIVGCEPLDDLVGIGSVQSCAEPGYDFELQYRLRGAPQRRLPVPICADTRPDHRSPPGSRCGPGTVLMVGGA